MKKLRLLSILMATISLLASCGGKTPGPEPSPEIKEYTITINSDPAGHCTPSKSTLKFKENVFDPITVPYTIDPNFVITRTEVDEKENECDFDNEKKELMIIPKKNADFSITIITTHMVQVSYITLINKSPEHITPRRTSVPFEKHGKYYPVSFSYVINKYCSVAANVESGEAEFEIDTANNKLIVTPNGDDDILINIYAKEEYKIISFEILGGKFGPLASPSIMMPYGKTWGECVDKSKQIASLDEMDFKGWSFDSSGYGEPIPDTTKIDKNTPNTVYAIYNHRISLNSKSLKIKNLVYEEVYGEDVLTINVRLKDTLHYRLPGANDIKINISGQSIEFKYYTYSTAVDAKIDIPIDKLTSKTVYITITDNQPTYNIEFVEKEGLRYEATSQTVKKGETYQFKLFAVNQNEEVYYISDHLTITLQDEKHQEVLDDGAYQVKFKDETRQEADVTILARYVQGNLTIEAVPLRTDAYYYDFWGHGIKLSRHGDTDWGNNFFGYQQASEGLTFYFEHGISSALTDDHVLVIINDEDYYLLSNLPEKYSGLIERNISSIVIYPHTIEEINSLRIDIYHPNYKDTFGTANNWKIISTLSSGPEEVVSQLFPVGTERYITLSDNNSSYKVRIIGVNHDPLASDSNKTAGLTIEFENVITDNNGGVLVPWDKEYSYNFPNSTLNINILNGSIFSQFSEDLQSAVKDVNKVVGVGKISVRETTTYTTKLFPLSDNEISETSAEDVLIEGTTYEYYKGPDAQEKRKKQDAYGGEKFYRYWLRSPIYDYDKIAKLILENGTFDHDRVKNANAFAPAFCV